MACLAALRSKKTLRSLITVNHTLVLGPFGLRAVDFADVDFQKEREREREIDRERERKQRQHNK